MNSRSSIFLAIALTWSTGEAFGSILAITGVFAPSGRSFRMLFTFRCASSKAMSISAEALNSSKTMDALSMENVVTSEMFSSPLKASSNGLATCVSTVAGEAPGYMVVTVRIGGAKSGNNS
ncbi:hypothetical protein D3C86_1369050 [compost metagenome]